ncbi:MAG: beta-N-acetylhexosaminidase [Gemmatimonadaceae bacterium]
MLNRFFRITGRCASLALLAACAHRTVVTGSAPRGPVLPHAIVPAPESVQLTTAQTFAVDSATEVVIDATVDADVQRIANEFASLIRVHPIFAPLGTPAVSGRREIVARRLSPGAPVPGHAVQLVVDANRPGLGPEGYELTVTTDRITVIAATAAGMFYGVQTLRQLLPASVEHRDAVSRGWRIPTGRITDHPRFGWRGAMLDVSRHFLDPDDVKHFIDVMSLYKLNRLHLHLSDDQGWRIEIKSRPRLASIGSLSEVGGGAGGFYTQEQFVDLVAYARRHFIDIVPEIEMPAHSNAALSSYAELNCDSVAPPAYSGINVSFSAMCVQREDVYRFVDDVVREIGALVPSPWFHIGGDEVPRLTHDEFARFIERVEQIVKSHGKTMVGWGEIATTNVSSAVIVQHWNPDSVARHVARGGHVILSPSKHTYLDMKYDSATVLGLTWAGLISVQQAYDWEPAALLPGVPESSILGVEGPLWAETLEKRSDYEYLAFPRLVALAEVGWSAPTVRGWTGFRSRLAEQGPRLQALGVNFYRAPEVPWAR